MLPLSEKGTQASQQEFGMHILLTDYLWKGEEQKAAGQTFREICRRKSRYRPCRDTAAALEQDTEWEGVRDNTTNPATVIHPAQFNPTVPCSHLPGGNGSVVGLLQQLYNFQKPPALSWEAQEQQHICHTIPTHHHTLSPLLHAHFFPGIKPRTSLAKARLHQELHRDLAAHPLVTDGWSWTRHKGTPANRSCIQPRGCLDPATDWPFHTTRLAPTVPAEVPLQSLWGKERPQIFSLVLMFFMWLKSTESNSMTHCNDKSRPKHLEGVTTGSSTGTSLEFRFISQSQLRAWRNKGEIQKYRVRRITSKYTANLSNFSFVNLCFPPANK